MNIIEITKELGNKCGIIRCLDCPFYLEDNFKQDYCFFKYNSCPPCDWDIKNICE